MEFNLKYSLLAISFLFCFQAYAKDDTENKKLVPVNSEKSMKIIYGNSQWNKDPNKIDEATVIFRDASNGKIVKIQLFETTPDSSTFSGVFMVSWGNINKIVPEIFIPAQDLMNSSDGRQKVLMAIEKRELARKPFMLTRDENKQQQIEVFDKREQVQQALAIYRAKYESQSISEQAVSSKALEKTGIQNPISTQKLALEQAAKLLALQQQQDRIRIEQIEEQKKRDRELEQEKLNESQKNTNKQKAAEIAKEALALYAKNNFVEALKLFETAVDLDPDNKTYYYTYAISLYRNEQFNKSIVVFNLVKTYPNINNIELQYYLALNFYALKEWPSALKNFSAVKKSSDKNLSANAAFYEGIIYMGLEEFENSQEAFEFVLDNSSDANLDKRAEEYIEQLQKLKYYAQLRKSKFFIEGNIGLQQDSNILLLADGQESNGVASDEAGIRTSLGGSLEYRPIYSEMHEWSTKLGLSYTYSIDDSFNSADPLAYFISFPYKYKSQLWGKTFISEVSPGYEDIWMDPNDTGTKESISTAMKLDWLNTFVMNNDWISSYALKLSNSDSTTTSSVGDEDSDALNISLAWSNINFIDAKKSKMLNSDISYTLNSAKGDNQSYTKINLSVNYSQPSNWWDTVASVGLSYALSDYADYVSSPTRSDNTLGASLGLTKAFKQDMNARLSYSYTKNDSNIDDKAYDKYIIGILFSAKTSL